MNSWPISASTDCTSRLSSTKTKSSMAAIAIAAPCRRPPTWQRAREILEAAKAIRAERAEARRVERIAKLIEIADGNSELQTGKRYPVVYADPPWQFRVYDENSSIASEHGAAGVHYPCMSTDAICALPVPSLASPDAALFMWTTVPHLRESFDVLASWDFEYKTNIVWVKDKIGLGYFVRNQHELLLVATRGDMPSPSPSNRPPSVITAPRPRAQPQA
jgi:hypothetical protein